MKATPSLYLSRFSAKFNRASWNHLAPGNLIRSDTTFSYFRDDSIPEYCHTADQKSGIFSTDHLYSSGYVFFFKQKTAYEIGLGIPAEPLFRSLTLIPIKSLSICFRVI